MLVISTQSMSLSSDTESLSLEEPVKSASPLSDSSAFCLAFLLHFHDGFGLCWSSESCSALMISAILSMLHEHQTQNKK